MKIEASRIAILKQGPSQIMSAIVVAEPKSVPLMQCAKAAMVGRFILQAEDGQTVRLELTVDELMVLGLQAIALASTLNPAPPIVRREADAAPAQRSSLLVP